MKKLFLLTLVLSSSISFAVTDAQNRALKIKDIINITWQKYYERDKSNDRLEKKMLKKIERIFNQGEVDESYVFKTSVGTNTNLSAKIIGTKCLPLYKMAFDKYGLNPNKIPIGGVHPIFTISNSAGGLRDNKTWNDTNPKFYRDTTAIAAFEYLLKNKISSNTTGYLSTGSELIYGSSLTRDSLGKTHEYSILMRAVESQNPAVVKAILSKDDLDLDLQNERGETALHIAFTNGATSIDVVRLLLEAGANPNILTREGMLPEDYARQTGSFAGKTDDARRLINEYR